MSLLLLFKPARTVVVEPEPEPEPQVDGGISRYAGSKTRRAFFGYTSRAN